MVWHIIPGCHGKELDLKLKLLIYVSTCAPNLIYCHELWVVTEILTLQIGEAKFSFFLFAGWLGSPLREGEELRYSEGSRSRTTAALQWKPVQVDYVRGSVYRASDQDTSNLEDSAAICWRESHLAWECLRIHQERSGRHGKGEGHLNFLL